MSLINQMLKDLEARRKKQEMDPNLLLNLEGTGAIFPNSFFQRNTFLTLMLLFSVLMLGFSMFSYMRTHSKTAIFNSDFSPEETYVTPPPDLEPPLSQLESVHVNRENTITKIELSFSQPQWYTLQSVPSKNILMLTLDTLDFSKICKTPLDTVSCFENLFPENQEDFAVQVIPAKNEKNQYNKFFINIDCNITFISKFNSIRNNIQYYSMHN